MVIQKVQDTHTLLHGGGHIDQQCARADTHTHWEEEARPRVGIGGCRDAQKAASEQDAR